MANRVRDLRRSRFGKLVAINREYNPEEKESYWLCLCDCGKYVKVRRSNLLSGHSTSCGCYASEKTSERSWKGFGEISQTYWYDLHRNADYRNVSFSISIEEAWNLFLEQEGRCALTGEQLVFYKRRKKDAKAQTASLDRIDNDKGYSKDNCMWVHKEVNRLKSNFPIENLLYWCRRVTEYHNDK